MALQWHCNLQRIWFEAKYRGMSRRYRCTFRSIRCENSRRRPSEAFRPKPFSRSLMVFCHLSQDPDPKIFTTPPLPRVLLLDPRS